ncbi:RM16 protein, partial [Polypterus senegalus]
MFWYRQLPGRRLEPILQSFSPDDTFSYSYLRAGEHFTVEKNHTLVIRNVTREDAATYYCSKLEKDVCRFGDGIELRVDVRQQESVKNTRRHCLELEIPPTKEDLEGEYQAMGGGFLHWGHFEMMRLTINRKIDSETTFARWGVNAPDKPITRKGLGKRMGGGKGEIDHYVTPVRCGRIIVELGGHVEFQEVEPVLTEVVKKLPFPAKVVSRESLAAMKQEEQELELNNQNPWTFKRIVSTNMLGIRKVLSPYDLKYQGKYSGKFRIPGRV